MIIDSFSGVYGFLSNFSQCTVVYDNIHFPTVEHAYQAAKCTDSVPRLMFASNSWTAGQAKKAGRYVTPRPDWESVKVEIMRGLLRQKFSRGTRWAALLLRTGETELIEGNTWNDTFWGVCDGVGENMLGKLLMEIREELKRA